MQIGRFLAELAKVGTEPILFFPSPMTTSTAKLRPIKDEGAAASIPLLPSRLGKKLRRFLPELLLK